MLSPTASVKVGDHIAGGKWGPPATRSGNQASSRTGSSLAMATINRAAVTKCCGMVPFIVFGAAIVVNNVL